MYFVCAQSMLMAVAYQHFLLLIAEFCKNSSVLGFHYIIYCVGIITVFRNFNVLHVLKLLLELAVVAICIKCIMTNYDIMLLVLYCTFLYY